MPKRNSSVKPQLNNTPILRKSPRLQLQNQQSPLDPKTPDPILKSRPNVPDFSPLSSSNKGFVKNVSKNIEESNCGLNNLGKLSNGFVRSGTGNSDFGLRRSPRLSGKVNFIDDSLEKESFNKKELLNLGNMEVGFDFGKQCEGKTESNKRVLRSSNRENKKVNPDAERVILAFDSGKQSESNKRVTQGSIRENAYEILIKKNFCDKGLSDVERVVAGFDSGKQAEGESVTAKRVMRSSFRGNVDVIAEKGNKCENGLSDVKGPKKGFDLGNKQGIIEFKVERRVTRGSIRENADEINKKRLLEANSCDRIRGNLENDTDDSLLNMKRTDEGTLSGVIDRVDERERDVKGKQIIGVKRKRNREGEGPGWTQDQELALQRAYFAAKPTPNFWKRVAKLVPGKSAQDCFNKINADHLTPTQLCPRSRATNRNISSFSLSASKLLRPEDSMIGKITRRKQNGHLAQKTVRHMLQKHYNVDQGYEADLFSVLESTFSPSAKSFECGASYFTPQREKDSNGLLNVFHDKSSSGLKKRFSRLSGSKGESLVSPPVLKPVKNKALHEKYIDQMHCRDAKRRVASRKEIPKKSFTQKSEPIKLLKDALVLDANDFIHRFQHNIDSAKREHSDDDDDENEGLEENEEED